MTWYRLLPIMACNSEPRTVHESLIGNESDLERSMNLFNSILKSNSILPRTASICNSFTSNSRDRNIQLLRKLVQNHMQWTGRSSHHWSRGLDRSFQHLAQNLQCVDPSTTCHGHWVIWGGASSLEWGAMSKWCIIRPTNRSNSQKWRATLSLDTFHEVKVCESLSRGWWDSCKYQLPLPLPAFDSWKAGIVRDHAGKQLLLLCLSHNESHDPLRWTRLRGLCDRV